MYMNRLVLLSRSSRMHDKSVVNSEVQQDSAKMSQATEPHSRALVTHLFKYESFARVASCDEDHDSPLEDMPPQPSPF